MKNNLALLTTLTLAMVCTLLASCIQETELVPGQNVAAKESLTDPKIAIRSSFCYQDGESLQVFNPDNQNPDFYKSEIYVVEWRKDDVLVESGYELHCTCGGTVKVTVTNVLNGASAVTTYTAMKCLDE